jgi:hypothetical protein
LIAALAVVFRWFAADRQALQSSRRQVGTNELQRYIGFESLSRLDYDTSSYSNGLQRNDIAMRL